MILCKHPLGILWLAAALVASAKPVTPQQAKDGKFFFTAASVRFEVDPSVGARISSLKLDGTEFMYIDRSDIDWGSSFWPSPQAPWFWPPPQALDSAAFTGGITGNAVILTSGKDKRTGYIFSKKFRADDGDTSVTIDYVIRNAADKPQQVAPWAITRVLPGGLTFWPKGQGQDTGALAHLLKLSGGALWFDYAAVKVPDTDAQAYGDGAGGWMAHVDSRGIILVKKFADVPPDKQPKGENEIELYTDPKKRYQEIEHQGPMVTLAPGDSTVWEVKWYLRKLPPGAKRRAGDKKLLGFAAKLAGRSNAK
jgi:hypothetical protein